MTPASTICTRCRQPLIVPQHGTIVPAAEGNPKLVALQLLLPVAILHCPTCQYSTIWYSRGAAIGNINRAEAVARTNNGRLGVEFLADLTKLKLVVIVVLPAAGISLVGCWLIAKVPLRAKSPAVLARLVLGESEGNTNRAAPKGQ